MPITIATKRAKKNKTNKTAICRFCNEYSRILTLVGKNKIIFLKIILKSIIDAYDP